MRQDSLDEASRAHKHWEKTRIRFKAAVHSGSLVDSLNDCESKYCLWFEEQQWLRKSSHDDNDVNEDPNTLQARLCLALKVLCSEGKDYSTANYCVSLDRGYGHVSAQQAAARMGVYTNSMMQTNRIGIPRNYLEEVKKVFDGCPQGCSHGPGAHDCRKFNFTMCHKLSPTPDAEGAAAAPWELCLWQDSKLIISYGNFFSGSRCGELTRGSYGSKESYAVWTPESIWHYNVHGRSATDGCDQLRKKVNLVERRIVRAGHKGITFVFDLAFTNATIMWEWLQRDEYSRSVMEQKFNKVRTTPPPLTSHVLLLSELILSCLSC